MSSRKNSSDSTSQNGVSFQAGSGSVATSTKNVNYSQSINDSKLVTSGAYNGHVVEVWGDGAVWDTVAGKFLFPGTDYNVLDIQRK